MNAKTPVRGAKANPLWRYERPWCYAIWLSGLCPFVFLGAVSLGFRPWGPPSPHAAHCGNCAFGDIVRVVVGIPAGTIGSLFAGAVVGGILDWGLGHYLYHRTASSLTIPNLTDTK